MKQPEHFMDIKRYALPDGDYELTTELRDLNRPDNEKRYQSPLSVRMAGNDLLQSSIQLLSLARPDTSDNSFCKNGIYMEPLARHTYGKAASELIFYHEIYLSDLALADDFLVTYRVETAEKEANFLARLRWCKRGTFGWRRIECESTMTPVPNCNGFA